MADVFISYADGDEDYVDQLVVALRKHVDVWHKKDLKPGDHKWQDTIKQIENAPVFIYIVSRQSKLSRYCKAEVAEAIRLGRTSVKKSFICVRQSSKVSIPKQLEQDTPHTMKEITPEKIKALIDSIEIGKKNNFENIKPKDINPTPNPHTQLIRWGLIVVVASLVISMLLSSVGFVADIIGISQGICDFDLPICTSTKPPGNSPPSQPSPTPNYPVVSEPTPFPTVTVLMPMETPPAQTTEDAEPEATIDGTAIAQTETARSIILTANAKGN